MTNRPDAILIAGPTASGKSALALRIAEERGALIINTDSMQVYRDLRVLTARPSVVDEARVPHACYGTVDGAINYSVGLWLADADAAISRAKSEELIPLFVGGTGLYFKALTQGLSDIPSIPQGLRTEIRAWAEGRTSEELHAVLRERDPVAAQRLRSTDAQRVLRAIEVHAATGQSLTAYQAQRSAALLQGMQIEAWLLEVDRTILRKRTDDRLEQMVRTGALDEAAALASRRLDPALPVMRALGVPSLLRHFTGEIGLETALIECKSATHAYLKRQTTFFRHQLPEFRPVSPDAMFSRPDENYR